MLHTIYQNMSTRKYGTRSEVWDGICTMTRGGLTKDDLMLSKTNKIVSKKKSEAAKQAYNQYGFAKRSRPEEKVEEPKKKKRRRRKKKLE